MHRVRLINKIIGPSNGIFPVCGRSGKLYGHASYMPEHGGPVLDMSLEDYEKDKFDIIGNRQSGQQWVPQFYEHLRGADGTEIETNFGTGITVVTREPADPIQIGGRTTCPKCGEIYSMADIHECDPSIVVESAVVTDCGTGKTVVVHSGHQKIRQFNELRKRAKATGVWKDGMKLKDLETALLAIHD